MKKLRWLVFRIFAFIILAIATFFIVQFCWLSYLGKLWKGLSPGKKKGAVAKPIPEPSPELETDPLNLAILYPDKWGSC